MFQDAPLLDLSSDIYDAVQSPERWPQLLETLGRRLDATDCGVVGVDTSASRLAFAALAGAGIVAPGAGAGGKLDRRLLAGLERRAGTTFTAPPDRICVGCADARLVDCFDEAGGGPFLALIVANDGGHYAAVFATRPAAAAAFAKAERNLLAKLQPHFSRGDALGRQLRRAERERRAALTALDRLAAGVIVVDADGQVSVCNGRAEAILADHDGLVRGADGLRTDSPAETAALLQAIREASKPHQGRGAVTVLSLRRPSMNRSLELLVAPLADGAETAAGALVFVSDPERRPQMASDALVHLYGLSRAEADLAAEIAAGKTLAEFADERARNIETARKTLKRVFAKTDTGRQAELVGRLLSGPLAFVNGSAVAG